MDNPTKATVRELRARTGMTQAQFSAYIAMPQRTLEDWERGVRIPPDYVVRLIAEKISREYPG